MDPYAHSCTNKGPVTMVLPHSESPELFCSPSRRKIKSEVHPGPKTVDKESTTYSKFLVSSATNLTVHTSPVFTEGAGIQRSKSEDGPKKATRDTRVSKLRKRGKCLCKRGKCLDRTRVRKSKLSYKGVEFLYLQ